MAAIKRALDLIPGDVFESRSKPVGYWMVLGTEWNRKKRLVAVRTRSTGFMQPDHVFYFDQKDRVVAYPEWRS